MTSTLEIAKKEKKAISKDLELREHAKKELEVARATPESEYVDLE